MTREYDAAMRERECCALIAEKAIKGAALEIGPKTYPLGIMANNPAEAQRLTALAIAAAIRNL